MDKFTENELSGEKSAVDNELKMAIERLENADENSSTHGEEIEKFNSREHRDTERRIAKAQSEMAESVRRAEINAQQMSAALGYGEKYRRKLLAEEAKRRELERKAEEERLNAELMAERQAREEEAQKRLDAENELLRQRNEESDELIRRFSAEIGESSGEISAPELESQEAEPEPKEQSEPQEPSETQEPSESVIIPVLEEKDGKILFNIDECSKDVELSGGILCIPPHTITVPVFNAPLNSVSQNAAYNPVEASISKEDKIIEEYECELAEKFGEREINSHLGDLNIEYADSAEADGELNRQTFAFLAKDTIKRIKRIDSQIAKIEKREKGASGERGRELITERLSLQKEAVDILCTALVGAVHTHTAISKYKRLLARRIADYNLLLKEVSIRTGTDITLLSSTIPNDIIEGRKYQKTQNISLVGKDVGFDTDFFAYSSRIVNSKARKKQLRRGAIMEKEEKQLEKIIVKSVYGKGEVSKEWLFTLRERLLALGTQRIKDEELVEARFNYLISSAKTDKYVKNYLFETRRQKKGSKNNELKLLRVLKKTAKRAVIAESLDNARYYEIVATDTQRANFKRVNVNRAELESLRMEMETLLRKRDMINKRLEALYIGESEGVLYGTEKKCQRAKRRAVKKAHNKLRKTRKLLESNRIPLDIQEDMYELMNAKILKCGALAELDVRIKKARGQDKKQLKRERRRTRKDLQHLTENIGYFKKKKIEKRVINRKTRKSQLAWLIFLVVLAGGGFAVYYFFGGAVKEYLSGLFGGFING